MMSVSGAEVQSLPSPFGMARLAKLAFDGLDLLPLRQEMLGLAHEQPANAALLLDLSALEQYLGQRDSGLNYQALALAQSRLFRSSWNASSGALRVLALAAPGEIGINTPIEFLLQGSDVVLYTLYVIPGQPLPDPLPEHDIAIVTVNEWDRNQLVMRQIDRLIPFWPCPVLNRPSRVQCLARDQAYREVTDIPGMVMPATVRVPRAALAELAREACTLEEILPDSAFPVIVRPVESQAGRGLARLQSPAEIVAYLLEHPEGNFFVSRYIDYSSADGLFRKYRVVMIGGRPYACHMAVAREWAVWYLNADMALSPARREEEARFMQQFDAAFGERHRAALTAVAARLGLEYFAIDCAELQDGRLLVFEASTTMIVHDMDPDAIFPYKRPQIQRLFSGFVEMLQQQSRRGRCNDRQRPVRD